MGKGKLIININIQLKRPLGTKIIRFKISQLSQHQDLKIGLHPLTLLNLQNKPKMIRAPDQKG